MPPARFFLAPGANADKLRRVSRTVRLTFAGLALFFVLFPLTLQKPGLPQDLKSDEPAYYLMALSLVHDFDLLCETKDIQRLTQRVPLQQRQQPDPDDRRRLADSLVRQALS